MNKPASHIVPRLTALWALSESGLGGIMHAVKIPFTGFFLGGFAIVIITLIAHFSDKPFKAIMEAMVLVVLIKAAASPHSPPMAYIAVGFQGLIGALFFASIPFFRLAAILFGGIALFESAIQKFLVTTLIFGKSVWEALDAFIASVLKDLSLFNDFSASLWLIGVYTSVYVLWGFILGWWASGLPEGMNQKSAALLLQYNDLALEKPVEKTQTKRKKQYRLLYTFGILLFIMTTFFMQGLNDKIWYTLARTVAALLLLFLVLNPLVKWMMQQWVAKKRESKSGQLVSMMDTLPQLQNYLSPAMVLAKQQHKGLFVYKAFVENLIVLTLYNEL